MFVRKKLWPVIVLGVLVAGYLAYRYLLTTMTMFNCNYNVLSEQENRPHRMGGTFRPFQNASAEPQQLILVWLALGFAGLHSMVMTLRRGLLSFLTNPKLLRAGRVNGN